MMRGEAEGRVSRRKSLRQSTAAVTATNGESAAASERRPPEEGGGGGGGDTLAARRRSVRSVKRTGTLRRPTAGGGPVSVGSLRKRSSLRDVSASVVRITIHETCLCTKFTWTISEFFFLAFRNLKYEGLLYWTLSKKLHNYFKIDTVLSHVLV
jgi:hypothetical protein